RLVGSTRARLARLDSSNLRFNPGLGLLVELTGGTTVRVDRRTDRDRNRPGTLPHPAAGPEVACVVGYRHDRATGLRREERATHAVASRLTRRHPRALGKDDDPVALGDTLLPLLD